MKNMFLVLVSFVLLSGCAVVDRAAWVTDKVCEMSPDDQAALAKAVDRITYPNTIRVECN